LNIRAKRHRTRWSAGNDLGYARRAGINNWDFSITKDIKLGERPKLRIEADFFNLFNNADFAIPT
jgi:hypothetical protein